MSQPVAVSVLAGLKTVPGELYEAARVDGTNAWQRLIHITLPQLRRFILFASVLTMISAFTALFSLIFVMTGGGPGYGTTTLEFFVYQNAFGQANFGYGALLGVILFVIMAVVGLIQLLLLPTLGPKLLDILQTWIAGRKSGATLKLKMVKEGGRSIELEYNPRQTSWQEVEHLLSAASNSVTDH